MLQKLKLFQRCCNQKYSGGLKMAKVTYESIKMHDGYSVYTARFEPESGAPDGVIQAVHGFSEHVYRYTEMAEFFVSANYAFVIHDVRGFGSMPGKTPEQRKSAQGLVVDYNALLRDLETIRAKIDIWYPNVPVVLYGYSLGGNISINHLFRYKQSRYDKLILESPWLRLYESPPESAILALKSKAMMNPKLVFDTGLDTSKIARNKDGGVADDRSDDPYYHTFISYKLFLRTLAAGEYAIKNASRITIPTLLLVGGLDKIVSPKAMREFYNNAGENVIMKEYPNAFHSLHTDIGKEEVKKRMRSFILQSAVAQISEEAYCGDNGDNLDKVKDIASTIIKLREANEEAIAVLKADIRNILKDVDCDVDAIQMDENLKRVLNEALDN